MARISQCDICKKPTNRIIAKLHYIPAGPNGAKRMTHSHYSHHADVGECCEKILTLFNFRKRMTRAEYLESRRR